MAITSIGVGSNLPLEKLLTDLRNSENKALALIQSRQVDAQNRLSAYGKIQSAVEALQQSAGALSDSGTFGALRAGVSGDAITAGASPSAIAGQYSISVETLATAQSLVLGGVADRAAPIGSGGTLRMTLNDGSHHSLDLGAGTSIDQIVGAINSDPALGIRATIINDGSDAPHRLLLTAAATGTLAAVAGIQVAGNAELDDLLNFNAGVPAPNIQESPARNARLYINGIAIDSQGNQIENAIEGVSITVNKEGGQPVVLSITRDDAAAQKAINAFVSAYNNLQATLRSLSAYNVETQSAGTLTGDALARNVQSYIRGTLNATASSGALRSLSALGIKTNPKDGTLSVDDTALTAALKNHQADVRRLFAGENGVSGRMDAASLRFLGANGQIQSAALGVTRTADDLQKQYDAAATRIDARMEAYRRQFVNLDGMVAKMTSVSTYLAQQLSLLGSQTGSKS